MKYIIYLLICFFLVASCAGKTSQKSTRDASSDDSMETVGQKQDVDHTALTDSEVIGGIRFEFKCLSAVAFLNRAGRKVNPVDLKELEREAIVVLTISDTAAHKRIKENKRFFFSESEEELSSYLQHGILSDFTILQEEEVLFPAGTQPESIGTMSQEKISILLFFDSIDPEKEFRIQYNDKLFSAGLIRTNKLKINTL